MKKLSSKRTCPYCHTLAQDKKSQEICTKMPANTRLPQENLLNYCINSDALRQYQKAPQGEDPCVSCSYNRVIVDPGSFLFMKDTEPPVFIEVHRCQSCHQTYELKF